MSKQYPINLGTMICLIASILLIYYFLQMSYLFSFPIATVHSCAWHWFRHWHVLAVALNPICLALIIFGMGFLSVYFGNMLQRCIVRLFSFK